LLLSVLTRRSLLFDDGEPGQMLMKIDHGRFYFHRSAIWLAGLYGLGEKLVAHSWSNRT